MDEAEWHPSECLSYYAVCVFIFCVTVLLLSKGLVFQNNIPVFSPALTDGALGDALYFFSADNPGLIVDITEGTTVFIGAYLICLGDVQFV